MWNVERLEVYDKVCFLVKRIYILIRILPQEEKFALGDQMRRASSSIRLNILEGSGKRTSKEFASYLDNAMGSLREVRGCISIGIDVGHFGEDAKKDVDEILRTERLLAGYIKYVKERNVK